MTRFIPRDKLGRKARKQLDSLQRRTWPFPPVTRKIESGKQYSRHRKSREIQEEWNRGIFLLSAVFKKRCSWQSYQTA